MTMLGLCLSRYVHNGLVAQLGERCVRNAEVEGSNPFGSSRRTKGSYIRRRTF